jgi:hypothetical protein
MKELEVGDRVYLKILRQYSSEIRNYLFSEVVRVTKTQAILANGIKLKREIISSYYSSDYYAQIGDIYSDWRIVTDEILAEFKEWKETKEINDWFSNKVFTNEEKKQIYHIFNKENND